MINGKRVPDLITFKRGQADSVGPLTGTVLSEQKAMNQNYRNQSYFLWQRESKEKIVHTNAFWKSSTPPPPPENNKTLLPCMIFGWQIPSILQKVPVKATSESVRFVHVALFSGNKSVDVWSATSLCLKRNSEAWSFVSCSGRSLVGATQRRRLSVGLAIFSTDCFCQYQMNVFHLIPNSNMSKI